MSDNHKLPVSFHLVGLTAALIFCFFAATFFAYGYALLQDWQSVVSDPRHPYVLPVAQAAILALTSAVTFVLLVRRSLRVGAVIAIAYLSILLLLLCWSSVSWWSTSGGWPQIFASASHVAVLALKILAFAWLATLLVKMWSTILSTRP